MTNNELYLAIFTTEKESGLHQGITFEEWKIEKGLEEVEEKNDFSLLNQLATQYGFKATTRLIGFLSGKDIGKVTYANVRKGNKGDLVGIVKGTKGEFILSQSVYLTPNGKQAFRMNVAKA